MSTSTSASTSKRFHCTYCGDVFKGRPRWRFPLDPKDQQYVMPYHKSGIRAKESSRCKGTAAFKEAKEAISAESAES